MSDTREQFLDTAETLFAERGFYGVSIAAIADELGLSKQALLHHFGSKEKLYGEVLRRISERFDALVDDADATSDPAEHFKTCMLELQNNARTEPQQTALLMRELLDNRRRADAASTWYLKPFLNRLIQRVRSIPNWRSADDAEALALVYQLLGALNYYNISEPTLTQIFGTRTYRKLEREFSKQLARSIDATLAARR